MAKPVELTARAIEDLGKARKFHILKSGVKKAEKIIDEIFEYIAVLENPDYDFSKIGSPDEDFTHLKYNYRKLIKHHFKITYREGKSKIYVVRIFDTRQDPKKNK